MLKFLSTCVTFFLLILSSCYANSQSHLPHPTQTNVDQDIDSPVELRAEREDKIPPNFFAITFYKPTYILPYYYTGSPYTQVYLNNTPQNESLNKGELKYQLSFKVPVFKKLFKSHSTIYLAYTQLSYWQAYNKSAFFRETDYEPELFLANEVNIKVLKAWLINFLNVGAVHQSNGFGDTLERSWNRIYVEAITSTDNWMFSVKPWYVIKDSTMRVHNPNITNYLGHGQIVVACKYYKQVFSLQTHNILESGGRRATFEASWSFPLTSYLNGYVQAFSGYGQSLIEYNHHTNSIGVGIALSNWI